MTRIITLLFFAAFTLTTFVDFAAAQGAVAVTGLKANVRVIRDGRSIPYITAASEADLYLVQGYTTASDRLWQMDLMRRVARGETAELFGKTTLEEDKRWRRLGFSRVADESIRHLSPDLKAALENYAKGVNTYIDSLDETTMPIEFKILQYKPRHWTPSDTLVIGKILAEALSSTWRLDLLKASLQSLPKAKLADLTNVQTEYDVINFGKDISMARKAVAELDNTFVNDKLLAAADKIDAQRTASLERIGFYAEDLAASNNWVISGKRTADGKALLANDPHLLSTAPGIWYMTHLETPTLRVAGVTFPGVPGIVLGHNEHIAWGATNVGPDVQDLYLESFGDDGKYKAPGGWAAPKIRTEVVNVRANLLKPATEPVSFEVTETTNGPIILEEGGKKYALKWTATDPKNNDFAAFFLLNRAKDWAEFKNALSTYRGASQNFVYADTKGNIGWHIAGAIPLRRKGDGSLPYDGSTTDGDWMGFIPFNELPNLYNPSSGLIVTANQRIAGTDYKYPQLIRDFAAPWRARRLFDVLDANKKATMDSVSAAQHDAYNIPLVNLSKEIIKAKAASPETLALFASWDGKMTPDSRAALLVNEVRDCLARNIAVWNSPVHPNAIRERVLDRAIRERSPIWLPKFFADYTALMKACEIESIRALEFMYGSDRSRWTWAKASISRFPHPLAAAPLIGGQFATPAVALNGSGQTPNVASFVSMRFIASPGNWDATRHVIPLGQSGDPKSPHFKDQFDAWRTGEARTFPFSREAIEKAKVSAKEFTPKN